MNHKIIKDRYGREYTINQEDDINSCIIKNESNNKPDTTLDDNIDSWHQIY